MWSRRSAIVALLCAATAIHAQEPDEDTTRFAAAIALEESARFADAASALERFARERPASTLAPDALMEAADLSESRLFDPARALTSYSLVVTSYPQSRLAGRAATRKAELERMLGDPRTDAASLGAFTRLLGEAADPPVPAVREQVAHFLVEHPGFPLATRGQLWLARAAEQAGDLDEALRRYELAADGSDGLAARALYGKARLLLKRGRLREAEAAYEALARFSDPVSLRERTQGRSALRSARIRRGLRIASLAVLILFLLTQLRGFRWRPIPIEVRFLAPIAALFVLAGAFQQRASARAIALIAVGGLAITWLSAGRARGSMAMTERLVRALAAALAVAALSYLAVVENRLGEVVLETLRSGPEG